MLKIKFVYAAVVLTFSACQTKQIQEPTIVTGVETTNATDVAETTAAPLDTTSLVLDSKTKNLQ